jgi:hypothetical protein
MKNKAIDFYYNTAEFACDYFWAIFGVAALIFLPVGCILASELPGTIWEAIGAGLVLIPFAIIALAFLVLAWAASER